MLEIGAHAGSLDDLSLVKRAVFGDAVAREAIANLTYPLIQAQTKIFCKRFCHEHYYQAQCTLFPEWAYKATNAPLCDWGNHSYAWMLEDLCSPSRLSRYSGDGGARLTTYLFAIVNSLPFYERWKNWRFGRRIRVPSFIQAIAPVAEKCFFWLLDGDSPETIAQKAGIAIGKIEEILERIIEELTIRGKLHLLNKETRISLTSIDTEEGEDEYTQEDIPDHSWDPAKEQLRDKVSRGWEQLTPVEQFVLEAMVIEERDAVDVLNALKQTCISIKENVPPERLDRQQLYYFKRVALAKLAQMSGVK